MKKELFSFLLTFMVGFTIEAMAQMPYKLPPMPEKESSNLGFIADQEVVVL